MAQTRLFIYRRKPSAGSVVLSHVLNARNPSAPSPYPFARHFQRQPKNARPEYHVLYWGDTPEWCERYPGLNAVPVPTKKREVELLRAADVPTVEIADRPGEGVWLPRRANHVGGRDLLRPDGGADYYVRKEDVKREFRVHVWKEHGEYLSIRTGRKEPMIADHHGWIRSRDAGWHLVYDGHGVTDAHRGPAKRAVEALGLDFAAVDVAEREDGSVFVLEVNRAPGLEAVSAEKYAEHIELWIKEGGSHGAQR